jgi:hypothetical protein
MELGTGIAVAGCAYAGALVLNSILGLLHSWYQHRLYRSGNVTGAVGQISKAA